MVDADNNIGKEVDQKTSIGVNQFLLEDNTGPFFKEFTWYADGGATNTGNAGLIQDAHDMASGIAVILEMIEVSGIADDCADRPVLSVPHRGHLMRMAIASAHLLANACNSHIQAANDRYLERANQVGAPQ